MNYESDPIRHRPIDPSTQLAVFGGEKMQGWIANIVNQLEAAERRGASATDSWRKFGAFRGPEGAIRMEIPDVGSKLKTDTLKITGKEYADEGAITSFRLEDLLSHPMLYRNYPQLRDMDVWFTEDLPKNTMGSFNTSGGGASGHDPYVALRPQMGNDSTRSYLLHEIQHWIQEHEDFARGASPEMWRDPTFDIEYSRNRIKALVDSVRMRELMDKYGKDQLSILRGFVDEMGRSPAPGYRDYLDLPRKELIDMATALDKEHRTAMLADKPYDLYKKAAGEVEARNVQRRADMPLYDLRYITPEQSMDLPWIDQILLKGVVK